MGKQMPRWKRRGIFFVGFASIFVNLDASGGVDELAFLEGCFDPIMRSERISLLGGHLLSTMRC